MITQIDIMIMEWLNQFHNPVIDGIMVFFTFLGDLAIIWFVIAGYLMYKGRKKEAIGLVVTIILSAIVTEVLLKNIFMRPRPFIENKALFPLIARPTSSSFPSGHTTSSFAAATFLNKNRCFGWLSTGLALMISISRVYVNVHHPSDIIVGMIIGIVVGLFVQFVMKKVKIKWLA